MNQLAKTGMHEVKRETEGAVAEVGMAHRQPTRRKPLRKRPAQRSDADEIAGRAKHQRFMLDRQAQAHAEAEADIFLKSAWTRKTLGGMNDLRKSVAARANARPDLAAARGVLRHSHNDRDARSRSRRKRSADDARELREPPSRRGCVGPRRLRPTNNGSPPP